MRTTLRVSLLAAAMAAPWAQAKAQSDMAGMSMPLPASTSSAPLPAMAGSVPPPAAMPGPSAADRLMHHHAMASTAAAGVMPGMAMPAATDHATLNPPALDHRGLDHPMPPAGDHPVSPQPPVTAPATLRPDGGPASAAAMQDMPGMAMPMPGTAAAATADAAADLSHAGHAAMAEMPGMAPDTAALPPNDHVSPPAPRHPMPAMDMARMVDAMQMNDRAWRGMWLLDRLERSRSSDGAYATTWETEGWYGSDTNRLWLRSEGERSDAGVRDGRVELLWGHAYATFWDWQLGLRQDIGRAAGRQWLAAGVQGLAPYWFELQATAYLSQQGHLAARLEASRDLLLSQRLILTPQLELALYNKADRARQQPVGLAEAQWGLRLRYQINRQLAPYLGLQWQREGGEDAPAQPWRAGGHRYETRVVLGVRLWL